MEGDPAIEEQEVYLELCGQVEAVLHALEQRRRRMYGETPWFVESRVKKEASIHQKLERKRLARPGYAVSDMTDLAGTRVIVDGTSSAVAMAEFFGRERPFGIWSEKSEDFQHQPRSDGYRATHLILTVGSHVRPGRTYALELQIRTMLQHQWSLLSNSEFYKTVQEIPPSLLSRMRALSELLHVADVEADQLRRNRVLDDVTRDVMASLRDVLVERLGSSTLDVNRASETGESINGMLEVERQVRRSLVSSGRPAERALLAVEVLCASLASRDSEIRQVCNKIVSRVQSILRPIPSDSNQPIADRRLQSGER